jgi:hypothetical protein
MYDELDFDVLLGKTLAKIDGRVGGDSIVFTTSEGEQYQLWHQQDCCESVTIEDVIGNFDDLIGSPLLMAEKISNADEPVDFKPEYPAESDTWTFYKLATIKGYVTIRWYGESNGYYSEEVDFCKL